MICYPLLFTLLTQVVEVWEVDLKILTVLMSYIMCQCDARLQNESPPPSLLKREREKEKK